ncbi:hypothetical protein M0802_002057 [Mischocyttarus mexicanus]|nr:hypothetical protein M0802_002057 [Mischocyttarus mexicanus]
MDLHEKYMQFSTHDLYILEVIDTSFKNDPFTRLHSLVKFYNDELIKFPLDIKKLKTFHDILCYEYQIKFNSRDTYKYKQSDDISIENIFNVFFHKNQWHTMSEVLILYDILLLQMVLYCDVKSIKMKLEQFRNLRELYLNHSDETRELYIKVLECFLETLNLHCYIFNANKCKQCEEFVSLYIDDIKYFLTTKDNIQWKLIASILPKLNNTFDNNNIIFLVWDLFSSELEDLQDLLISLNTLVDYYFKLDNNSLRDLYIDLYSKDRFWLVITKGLNSDIEQHRKWAWFLLKKVIHFMSNAKFENLDINKSVLVPFLCHTCSEDIKQRNKEEFLLTLEALEEIQIHLVLPAFTYLSSLIKSNEICKNCFDIAWLRCIFTRILENNNNTIVKQGILYICKVDVMMYDEQFLELFVNVLNNTFLYEMEPNENESKVVKELTKLLSRVTESYDDSIVKKFLFHVSLINWSPIPIFCVTYALSNVFKSNQSCIKLEENDFIAIKSLASLNLNKNSLILRTASQINIIKIISFSNVMVNDLILLSNILYTFTSDETFKKDSDTWKIIVKWLPKAITNTIASNFVYDSLKQCLQKDKSFDVEIKVLVLMISLLYDAKLIFHTPSCTTLQLLKVTFDSLIKSDLRPYSNLRINIKVLKLMSYLLKENCNIITQMLFNYGNIIMINIIRYIKKVSTILSYEELDEFLNMITTFLNNKDLIFPKETMRSLAVNLYVLVLENIYVVQGLEYLSILHILLLCESLNILTFSKDIYEFCIKNINKFQIFNKESSHTENEKGKIMSRYLFLMTKLIHNYLQQFPTNTWKIDWYEIISNLLELEGIDIIPSVAILLKLIVEEDGLSRSEDITNFTSIVQLCWKITFEHKKNSIFSVAIKNLLTVIINSKFLNLPDIATITNSLLNQLIEESDHIPNLKKILLSQMESLDISDTIFDKINVDKLLFACLLHGYAKQDKKIENQIYLFIRKDFQDLYKLHSFNIECNIDATVKAHAVILLHRIITEKPKYALIFWQLVSEEFEKYNNKRYFKDSYLHKIKHRLMQILLILEPLLSMENIQSVQELMCNLILLESNQHSVRLMQEWLLIRIFVKYTDLHNKLWEFFEESLSKRPGCTSSIATVIYHVSLFLSGQAQCDFLTRAMPYIACCCLGQHYTMRLYNQVILVKLYELSKCSNFDNILSEYSGAYNAAVRSLQQGKLMEGSLQLQNDFYFSAFHPIDDYSLQTIYFEIPRLSTIYIDEWIPLYLFEDLNFKEYNNHPLRLRNLNNKLTESKVPLHLIKSDSCNKEISLVSTNSDCDLQKKIIPFKLVSSYESDSSLTLLQHPLSHLKNEGIIIVASLIDRPVNLGGLVRTCEVFGVKELIIGNIQQTKDPKFKNLCVSADKWINIKEVRPHQLPEYLLTENNKGWNLVGLEQTVNSTNLLNMQFKKKTILVLGNEKSGIPPNIISLLDVCVEIPQIGIIRSLNVHVSGAMCIWEYAKQHIFNSNL